MQSSCQTSEETGWKDFWDSFKHPLSSGRNTPHKEKQRQEQHFFFNHHQTDSKHLTNQKSQIVHSFAFTTIPETRIKPRGHGRSLPTNEIFKQQTVFLRADSYSNGIFKQPSKAKTCQQRDSGNKSGTFILTAAENV